MKHHQRFLLGTVAAALLTVGAACGGNDEDGEGLISPPAGEATRSATNPPLTDAEQLDRVQFLAQVEAQLLQVEMLMLDLEAGALNLAPSAQPIATDRIDDLRVHLDGVQAQVLVAKTVSDEEFDSMRGTIETEARVAWDEAHDLAADLGM